MRLRAEEARVLGSLVEKQLTTPQQYPLTLVALVAACNQSTNRDPVVACSEEAVTLAIDDLKQRKLARSVLPSHGRSAVRYRHILDETLALDARQCALLAVLLLRGPQTIGELRIRTERMATFDGLDEVEHELDFLASREEPLTENIGRQPGQKEERWATPLVTVVERGSGDRRHDDTVVAERHSDAGPGPGPDPGPNPLAELEADVAALRAEVADLRQQLYDLKVSLGD